MNTKEVALVIESSTQYGRSLVAGIAKYARLHHWRLRYELGGSQRGEPDWLKDWCGDAVITRCPTPTHSLDLAKRGVKVVNFRFDPGDGHCIYWQPDDESERIGRMVAEYFLKKGYDHFAYVGFDDVEYSKLRQQGFVGRLAEEGIDCAVLLSHERKYEVGADMDRREREFLESLPKPCAIMAACDERGVQVLGTCLNADLNVPEEIAVMGVDNDPLLCNIASPPLSSVLPDVSGEGWLLAAALDRMMSGETVEAKTEKESKITIIERQSSSQEAIDDEALARALHLIRTTLFTGIQIDELAQQVGLSRRSLERRFARKLRTSISHYINGLIVSHAKELLAETDYTVEAIADMLGLDHPQRLYKIFQTITGLTPGGFRRRMRDEGEGG